MEVFVVLAFGIGWAILEWQCKQLDKKRDQEAVKTRARDKGSA